MTESEKIAKKLFSLVNLKKDIDYQDPDYGMILKKIRTIPEGKILDFYAFIMDRGQSFNGGGILKRNEITPSVEEFMGKISKEIWERNGVEEKSELLSNKMISVYDNIVKNKSQQEQFDFLGSVNLEKIYQINSRSEKEKLFSSEELSVIGILGFKAIVGAISFHSKLEVRELIEKAYKSFFTKRYIVRENKVDTEIVISLPEPNRF